VGETYNIGGDIMKKQNIECGPPFVICWEKLCPRDEGTYKDLITTVQGPPGMICATTIDASKIQRGWAGCQGKIL